MKRLVILGAVWALAMARPEQYKEKEDFQFSRSSSDEGHKSGYYGAQRGNMGGNYERAHNMDNLAQNQMSGLVRQVEGELGDGARMRSGSVYSAANSRGTYGSGHYDLSNLGGRNFQEGTSVGDSQSQSSHSASSAYNAAGYTNSQSQSARHSGYQATGYSGQSTGHSGLATGYSGQATGYSGLATGHSGLATGHSGLNLQTDNLQALDQAQGAAQYDYGRQTSHAAGYNAQSGYQLHAAYDTSNTNAHSGDYGSNVHTRLVSATPVRIVVRPGTRVFVPIAAQTYDVTHGSSMIDQNSLNSEAEVLSNDNQRTVYRPSNAKHYESSYNYRKEWEKHDTIPATIVSPTTTENPFPRNSELYEDGQAHSASSQYDSRRVDSQRAHSAYGGYNANVKSTSGQSRLNYDTQRNGASLTNANSYSRAAYGSTHEGTSSDANAYNVQSQYNTGRYHAASLDALSQAAAVHNTGYNAAAADLNSQVENLNSKPKSYQSAYSYHKSWERQGDPYVIKPVSGAYYDGQPSSQRLTTGSTQNLGYSTGSHYQHSHASGADCDENGHIRVARSANTDQFREVQQESQNLEEFGQQQQSQNLEDFGQQQQSQNLEDFGQQQQSQNLEDFGQQQQSQNLEDFGQQQQSQNLENFGQQQQSQNLDYFSQQQQNQNLEAFGKPEHEQKFEDLGQQAENSGQQAEVVWDSQQEGGQQAENTWDNLENLSQQSQNKWDDVNHTWDKFEDLGQKPQDIEKQVEQNNQSKW